jgi:DNA helicase-2/ATP-dependent DNA helicase PcrA
VKRKGAVDGFKLGSRVRHPKFGYGTILRLEGNGEETKLTISFPGYGLKKLVAKYAELERV